MREKNRIKAKITYMLMALAIGWPCGFIVSATGYYITGMKETRTALQFMLAVGAVALVLSLVSGIPFRMLTESRIRNGLMPINTFRREQSNFLCFLPQNAVVQLLVCSLIVGVRFLLAAGGVAVLLGAMEFDMDILAGSLLCGLLGGMAVVNMAHYMMMTKASVMDTEARIRSGAEKRNQGAAPKAARPARQTILPEEDMGVQPKRKPEKTVDVQPERMPEPELAPEAEVSEEAIQGAIEKVIIEETGTDAPAETKADGKSGEPIETEKKPAAKVNIKVPEFDIPKISKKKTQEFKAPQPNRKVETETPTEDFDLPKETRHYPPNATTGVMPDMEKMGFDYMDLDNM